MQIILSLLLILSINTYAQEDAPTTSSGEEYGLYSSYSVYDMWLPGKFGFAASYGDKKRTYELTYQKASYSFDLFVDDIGSINDQRISLTTRSHTWGNSFNFQYGVSYNSFSVDLGQSFVSVDAFSVKTYTVMWGISNRWTFDNGIVVGADWFRIFWPLAIADSDDGVIESLAGSKKEDINKIRDTISNIPTFSVLNFEVGYRF